MIPEAVREVMKLAEGSLALAVIRKSEPDLIVGARRGSPLVVGYGGLWGENYWYATTNVWEDERLLAFVPREEIQTPDQYTTMMTAAVHTPLLASSGLNTYASVLATKPRRLG